ncbi:MAG: aldehyde oxidase [Deltaproteobacteria bacterium]|nr:aldehyde oxidase [Deltaproteobacteria bacterium]
MSGPGENSFRVVGHGVAKVDGLALACGAPVYTDDALVPGLLVGKILRSPHAHARIRRIETARARAMPGVHAVLTHADLPRVAYTTAGQGYPEPSPYDTFVLCDKARFVGDHVAAVAARSEEIARAALEAIEVDYELLEPVLDPLQATAPGAPVIHDEPEARVVIPVTYDPARNLAAAVGMDHGDVERALQQSDHVLAGEFSTHYAQHCPIEPHVTIVSFEPDGRICIRSSTQVPFHARRIVAQALQIPLRRLRVIKPRIGGGFGAKQEVLLEPLCTALALAARRPVKIELTRAEELYASRTRHPQHIWLRCGVNDDGTIMAIDLKIRMNTGAYGSHALTVVCNSGSKVLPMYPCDNIRFSGETVYTNLPVGGAYRGYGATQAVFAMEVMVDRMAEAIGMDPLAFRQRNHIRSGMGSPVFKHLGEGKPGVEQTIGSCGLAECIELGARAIGWEEQRRPDRGAEEGPLRRGVGMAILMQGSSIPFIDMGTVSLKMNEDGSVNMLAGATDIGTGSDTILAQIVAEVLTIDSADVIVVSSDTDLTPFDVGAYASSTTYLSGEAARKAALTVRAQVLRVAAEMTGVPPEQLTLQDRHVVGPDGLRLPLAEVATHSLYEGEMFQIGTLASHVTEKSPPPFSAHFAQVEVDTETGQVRVLRYVAHVDCGTAINPLLAEGQNEGALANGIGFALTEELLFDEKGRCTNPSFLHYKIPTTRDMPEVVSRLVPTYEPTGPFGAKSVSEIGINGALPAIANAIHDAVGVRLCHAPFTPEKVLAALREKGG